MNKFNPPANSESSGYIRAALYALFVVLPLLAVIQHGIIIWWAYLEKVQ